MRILILIVCGQLIYSVSDNDTKVIQRLNNIGSQEDSLIQWSDSLKLSWDDYLKNPALATSHVNHDAVTCTYIGYFNWVRYTDSLNFDFICYFDRNASWTKKKTETLLAHEQGHFDIAEIYVRMVRRDLSEYNPIHYNDAVRRYNYVSDSIFKIKAKTQNLYDLETDYSRNIVNQTRWQDWIDSSLVSLDNWRNTNVKMGW